MANDVGENSIEEIDDIVPGGNFGWPADEGKASGPKYKDPLYLYSHNDGCGGANVGQRVLPENLDFCAAQRLLAVVGLGLQRPQADVAVRKRLR